MSRNLELSSRNRELEAELRALHHKEDPAAEGATLREAEAAGRREKRRLPPSRKLHATDTLLSDKVR